jgi:hypothetical protein
MYTSFLHTFYFTAIGICVARISPLQFPSIWPDVVIYRHSKMCSRTRAQPGGELLVLTFERGVKSPYCITMFFRSIDFRPQYLFSNFLVSNTSRRSQLGSGIRSELRRNNWKIALDVSWNSSGTHSCKIDLPSSPLLDSPCPVLNLHWPLHKRAI